jgi:hypothetical protein
MEEGRSRETAAKRWLQDSKEGSAADKGIEPKLSHRKVEGCREEWEEKGLDAHVPDHLRDLFLAQEEQSCREDGLEELGLDSPVEA